MILKKPRLSQHFLVNRGLCQRIVDLAELSPADRVVEIGPGRGALTELLLDRAGEVWVIEVDAALVRHLHGRFGDRPALHLVNGDALRYPFEQMAAPFKVVANLPYAVASPILIRLLEARRSIPRMVLMFQREVAERLIATPGTRRYGVLSIIAQLYAEITLRTIVAPGSFRPRPKVESAVVTVVPRPQPLIPIRDDAAFIRLVHHGFAHRRKTLFNNLKYIPLTTEQCQDLLREAGIDPQRRPETLSIEEWGRLSQGCRELRINI